MYRFIADFGIFLSTPSARRATTDGAGSIRPQQNFYPRPPRGGRLTSALPSPQKAGISIHALREEGDQSRQRLRIAIFISIHALREEGDVVMRIIAAWSMLFLSTPSARRATKNAEAVTIPITDFYPRPPRGGRLGISRNHASLYQFLSTPSARRATKCFRVTPQKYSYFYPRPPRGGRQQKQRQNLYFQTNYTTFCTNLEEP